MDTLITDLKTENNFAFGKLYEANFYKISRFVQNNSGSKSDAEDVFQDAMLVLVEKLRQEDFQLTASINTYVYAICKNLWFKKLRDSNFKLSLETIKDSDFQDSITDTIENEKSYLDILKGYLTKITVHCNRLIQDIFFNGASIDDIQIKYGYSSSHNAQNQKYKCVEQLRKVKEQAYLKEN